jgi:type II secretory pathway pseudopilin PulG
MKMRRRLEGDEGETLLELVVAITILGVCVVAVASGIALSVMVSDIHRKQTTAGAYVRSYAEAVESSVATSGYVDCATSSTVSYLAPAGFSLPSNNGYRATIRSVRYWNGSQFTAGCSSPDKGLQELTLEVSSTDTPQRANEQLVVVVRKPCATSCG